jgi:lysozyme family protein
MISLSDLWSQIKITDQDRFTDPVERMFINRDRYLTVTESTGVPWQVIGTIHMREADGNFSCHLHNGDPLTARTVHVPKGRPATGSPPFSWEESAVDALTLAGMSGHESWDDMGSILDRVERYNGLGYRSRGIASPYLWAGTNAYLAGKFVADGVFNPRAIDTQPGVSGLLYLIGAPANS